jgi:hypothetical protein
MKLFSVCPICETSIQPDTEQCPNCRWVLTEYSLLDREKYNRLVDWAVDCYKELDELRTRSTYNKERLNTRLNRQRDDIDRLQEQVDKILINITDNQCNSLDSPEQDRSQQSGTIWLTQVQTRIVHDYCHHHSDFDKIYHPKIATITKETINNNWASEEKIIILTEAERGNYWIFESEGIYYLVPYYGKYFNPHSYQTLSTIFDCENYIPDYNNIQLLATAIVTNESTINPQTWRLQSQGKLVFSYNFKSLSQK